MRPQKTRHIESPPCWGRYLPEGRQQAAEMVLGLDMYEALRLVDAEGLSQETAAGRMGVSAPTLCRLLGEARRRVATALRDGWALRCEGGNVRIDVRGRHGHGSAWRHGRQSDAAAAQAAPADAESLRPVQDMPPGGPSGGFGRRARGMGQGPRCRRGEENGTC